MEFLKTHMLHSQVMSSSIRTPTSSPVLSESTAIDKLSLDEDLLPQGPSQPLPAVIARKSSKNSKFDAMDQAMLLAYMQSVSNKTEDPLVMCFKSLLPRLNRYLLINCSASKLIKCKKYRG